MQLADNASLARACHEKKPIQPVFIFDTDILKRFNNKADRRLSFIADALKIIDDELKQKGGRLLILLGSAKKIIPALVAEMEAAVFAGEDYEQETIARDKFIGQKIELVLSKQHVLLAPGEVLKKDGTPFKVFTPYASQWRKNLKPSDHAIYKTDDKGKYADFKTSLKLAAKAGVTVIENGSAQKICEGAGYEYCENKIWTANKAQEVLKDFIKNRLAAYAINRDFPSINGTSAISPYLRFGLVTIRQCYNAAAKTPHGAKWISELIWREFYMMIMFNFPETADQEFRPEFRNLKWNYEKAALEKWKAGKTGFPIVDAGMRQLLAEGWMHNRVRMIVASFLTKDLLIDWRAGEEYFAQNLMDYELASNVGGWQWAASTGTDAVPYFRIFNPLLQSRKFDPKGEYIRKYIPELKDVDNKNIHAPAKEARPKTYPAEMVSHEEMRPLILKFFKSVR